MIMMATSKNVSANGLSVNLGVQGITALIKKDSKF